MQEFTVSITTVIAGDKYVFNRTWPLDNEMARKLVGAEITMVLDECFGIYKAANLVDGDDPD